VYKNSPKGHIKNRYINEAYKRDKRDKRDKREAQLMGGHIN